MTGTCSYPLYGSYLRDPELSPLTLFHEYSGFGSETYQSSGGVDNTHFKSQELNNNSGKEGYTSIPEKCLLA